MPMHAPHPLREATRRLLERQDRLARELERLLEEEGSALARTDPAPLEAITRRKIDLALELERLETDRRRLLREAGLDEAADHAQFSGWLQRLDPDGELPRRWAELRARLQRCRERNHGNGLTIQLQRRQTESALRVLAGTPASETYTARGTAAGGPPGRRLGSA